MSSLGPSFGRGAMTNSWTDIKNADVVWIMGGNAAEAHPCGFKWVTEAKAERGAKLMVVDPRFNRSAAVADHYAPIRPGSDIAFLSGVVNYLLTNDKIHHEYVRHYTNAAYIVREDFAFSEGLFSGYDEEKRSYDRSTWEYEMGPDGFAVRDMTLTDPRCVFQLMKEHFAPYTPEMVERISGTPKEKFLKVAEWAASTANGERAMTIMYALGWTQHSSGAQNIRTAAMIQLLCGNIGIPGGGVNALRGHSNVQGITDVGTLTAAIPGYLALPTDKEPTLEAHLAKRTFKPLQPNQTSYWQNYRKFYVSFLKSYFGAKATKENDFGYNWLPKVDVAYDALRMFDVMHQGKTTGLLCQGFNPLMSIAYAGKTVAALAKLKFLVSMDPIETDTVRFWENHGEFNDVDTASIQTEVFMLPVTSFAEEEGSFTNSSRCIHVEVAGRGCRISSPARTSISWRICSCRIRKLYEEQGGTAVEPLMAIDWSYENPLEPQPDELLRELNGKALADLNDAEGKVIRACRRAARQLRRDARRRLDRRLPCGSTPASMGRRATSPSVATTAIRPVSACSATGAFRWPANRRIQYNRASADPQGKPWSEAKKYIFWNGERWTGPDVPDYRADDPAGSSDRTVHHERGRRLAPVGPRPDGGWSVPGSLRAVRVAGHQPDVSEDQGQSGSAGVQQRHGDFRRRRPNSRSSRRPTV